MNKTYIFAVLFAALTISVLSGCGDKKEAISEGVIEYNISYPTGLDTLISLPIPERMTFKFKENNIKCDLNAAGGFFAFSYITSYPDRTAMHFARIMMDKWQVVLDSTELYDKRVKARPVEIEFTNETKMIVGVKCKKAIVRHKKDPSRNIIVYYTDEINVDQSNWGTEYQGIDGVLMEYEMDMYGIRMRFTADTLQQKPVNTEEFSPLNGYEKISDEKMHDEISSLIERLI